MIPTIGYMIAAYIIFRAIELSLRRNDGWRGVTVIVCGVALVVFVTLEALDLRAIEKNAEFQHTLDEIRSLSH